MEFNALSQLNGSNPFPSQSLSQQQDQQHQQQHFYSAQSRNSTNSQMMYPQPGSYPSNTQATTQTKQHNTNLLTASNLPSQQYSSWGAGNVLNMATARRARPRPLTGTPGINPYNMPPPQVQTTTIQAPQSNDTMQWGQKSPGLMDVSGFDPDMTDLSQTLRAVDEDNGIIDLRQIGRLDQETNRNSFQAEMESRRPSQVSDSTYATTRLTTPEMAYPSDSDWSSAERTSGQFSSFSPMESPCHPMRPGSRSRASPNPHTNMRTSPYTLESNRRLRWSTGMNVPSQQPAPRAPYQYNRYSSFYGPSPLNPHNGLTSVSNDQGVTTFAGPGQTLSYSSRMLPSTPAIMFNGAFPDPPRQLPSQSLFPLLPSDRLHAFGGHFADMSDPPDLFASLHDPPSDPPEEDMNSTDPDLVPHEQELRFPGDLYTPRWVRGHGNKREGWCGLCKPGRWLVLKNSAYWYDKSFTHGVCAQTGAAFAAPEATRRVEGNADAWEGLCGHCGEWLSLVSSKKKGPTTWFRHVSKCHVLHKPKDVPKRRRGTAKRHTLPDAIITDVTDNSLEDQTDSEVKAHATGAAAEPESEPDHSMFNNDFVSSGSRSGARSAAVSPKTTPADRLVEQVIDQTMSESNDSTPLTAIRVGMEVDELPEPMANDNPQIKYESSEIEMYRTSQAESQRGIQRPVSMAQPEQSMITCADLVMSKSTAQDSKSDLQLQTQDLNFKAPPSPAITPISTPQLSATSLSTTPQIDTPHHSMPLLGLGVQGLHVMGGIPEHTTQEFPFTFNLEEFCSSSVTHDIDPDGFSSEHDQHFGQNFNTNPSSESSSSNSQPTTSASSYTSTQPTYSSHDLSAHLGVSNADLRPVSDLSEDILGLPLDMRIRFEAERRKYSDMDGSNMPTVGGSDMTNMGSAGMLQQFGGMF